MSKTVCKAIILCLLFSISVVQGEYSICRADIFAIYKKLLDFSQLHKSLCFTPSRPSSVSQHLVPKCRCIWTFPPSVTPRVSRRSPRDSYKDCQQAITAESTVLKLLALSDLLDADSIGQVWFRASWLSFQCTGGCTPNRLWNRSVSFNLVAHSLTTASALTSNITSHLPCFWVELIAELRGKEDLGTIVPFLEHSTCQRFLYVCSF